MRGGIGLVLVGVAAVGFVMHRHREDAPTAPTPAAVAAAPVKAVASPPPVNEHNWAKNALDRASAVKRQVAEKRREDGRE